MLSKHMLRVAAIILATFLGCQLAQAQPKEKPPRHVRLLAVGDSPPFRQEIRDGVAYELEPPPDSLPPLEVIASPAPQPRAAAAAAEAPKLPPGNAMLRLGLISPPMMIAPGAGPLVIRRFENGVPGEPWLRLNRPETGDMLVLLWRAPGQKDWKSPSALLLPDNPADFPAGTVRILNLFPQPVRIAWGNEVLTLDSRKMLLKTVDVNPGADSTRFQVLVPDASGKLRRYYSGAVTQQARERGLIVIHRADGESPRRPLKVTNLRESAPAPEPEPEPVEEPGL